MSAPSLSPYGSLDSPADSMGKYGEDNRHYKVGTKFNWGYRLTSFLHDVRQQEQSCNQAHR
jgi:hypothetical protein